MDLLGLPAGFRSARPGYEAIADHVAFYAGRVEAAFVDDERVTP